MDVVLTSPDWPVDARLRWHLARALGASLHRFSGRIRRVRVRLRAVRGRREAPRAQVAIHIAPAQADAPEVIVAHRGPDPLRAIDRAARRAGRSLRAALAG